MKVLLRLFRYCSWPQWKHHRLRWLLGLTAVLLAVVLFVSMQVLETSIVASFQRSMRVLAGHADVSVTHGSGIEVEALARIEKIAGLRAAPVVQQTTFAPKLAREIMILGIDFARDAKLREYRVERTGLSSVRYLLPRRLILSRDVATQLNLKSSDELSLSTPSGVQDFQIAGYLADDGPLGELSVPAAILNIRSAQQSFGSRDRYDRIDVAGPPERIEELRRTLGPDYLVQDVEAMNPLLAHQLKQLQLILDAVTFLALLTAIFLIYNSMSLSVVERIDEICILRALGADRRQIMLMILGEAALLGLTAAALGIGLGLAFSELLLDRVADHTNTFAKLVNVRELSIPTEALLGAAIAAVLVTVAGALKPAWSAFQVEPAQALVQFQPTERAGLKLWQQLTLGGLLFIAAAIASYAGGHHRAGIFTCIALAYCCAAMIMPAAILMCSRIVRAASARFVGVQVQLALDNIISFPARTSLTVLAFATSLSIVVAVSGGLLSLETQMLRWLDRTLTFDLALQTHDPLHGSYGSLGFPESVRDEVLKNPEVARSMGFRTSLLTYENDWVLLAAYDAPWLVEYLQTDRSQPIADEQLRTELQAGGAAISTNFARLHGAALGDQLNLKTPTGVHSFRVIQLVDDLRWPRGTVFIDRELFRKFWKDDALDHVKVDARPGTSLPALQQKLTMQLNERFHLSAFQATAIREGASQQLHEWFQIADSQIIVALFVGAVGVANAVLISLVNRKRQWALLAAIGASRRQIQGSLAWEAVILGGLSAVTGVALGMWALWWPMIWLSYAQMGYTLTRVIPWGTLLAVLLLGVLVSLLAGIVPVLYSRRLNLVSSLGYE
jgi:putative ABC transport system permease protein